MPSSITASEFDRAFDAGEDITPYLDPSTAERPNQRQRRVSVDMVPPMVARLDRRAGQLGVSRQSLIKVWLGERLDEEDAREEARRAAV